MDCLDCSYQGQCFIQSYLDELDREYFHTKLVRYLRRQTLCKEGDFSPSIRLVLEGFVMVLAEGPESKNIIFKILGPGDFLGVSALCGDDTYSFSAIAITDALVCSVEREAMIYLMQKNGEFALKLARWYCSNVTLLIGKLKTIGFHNQHGRLADALLYLDRPDFREGKLYSYLSRRDIAWVAGMPMESTVRILSEFSDAGLIRLRGKEIDVLDRERLMELRQKG